jgi:hypothetical protein
MYVYLQPKGGLNDILVTINRTLTYCNQHKRILLVDLLHSNYTINCKEYFTFSNKNILCDSNEIASICNTNPDTYPSCLQNKLPQLLKNELNLTQTKTGFMYNTTFLDLPKNAVKEHVIVYISWGGGNGYPMFRHIQFNDSVQKVCNERYNMLQKPYISIHIRNTDLHCNYQKLYTDNEQLIHSYNTIYIATDDIHVLNFFTSKSKKVRNFTTYPTFPSKYINLHKSNVDSNTKIIDLLCDIYIVAMSDMLLSNSAGGFIHLLQSCWKNKQEIIQQFTT